MDKPIKPTNLIPRSFGGVKNNFSSSLQSSGYEDGVPAIYGGDNLNYQLDATGKELDYCEKICDYINAIPINKTPIVDANNKLVYTQYDIRVYNATETYYENDYLSGFVNREKHIYRCKQNNVTGQPLSDETYFERVDIMGNVKTIGRNIGEIVPSAIPLTDAGLHLLDGTLISGSGIYSDFVTYIAGLYNSGDYTAIFDTEANWQSAVTSYGVCGKFVYNSVNNTVRLPKITGIIEGTTDVNALGDLVEAGLPNITGVQALQWAAVVNTTSQTSALYNDASVTSSGAGGGTAYGGSLGFDASRSSSIYGNSSTVQPQTIKVLYYIVVATSTKTDVQVDIDEIATDLNNKADIDLSNTTPSQSFIDEAMVWGLPDYSSAISISGISTTNVSFTVPSDGYISIHYSFTNGWDALYVDDKPIFYTGSTSAIDVWSPPYPIYSGSHTFRTLFNASRVSGVAFYPMKGAS